MLDDALLRIVPERLDTRRELHYFAAREWESAGYGSIFGQDLEGSVRDYEPSPGWLRKFQDRPPLMVHGPYGGGCHPW